MALLGETKITELTLLTPLSTANGGTGNTSVDTTPTASSTKMVTSGGVKTALDTKANLASPTFTGTPQITTTPSVGDNSHKIADTAFVKIAVDNSVPYITGTGSTAGTWLGQSDAITSYYDGLLILYKIPIAGASTTTLNINNLGAKTCYLNNTTKLTTHYPVNQPILLVYSSTNSGCWVALDNYDSNSNTYDRTLHAYAIKAASAIVGGHIIGYNGSTGYIPIAKGTSFSLTAPILYAAGDIAANATTTTNYNCIPFNATTWNGGTSPGFTSALPVYLKGTLSGTTFTVDSTTMLTQTLPSSADGKQYMYLGTAHTNAVGLYFDPVHPIYEYSNGILREITNRTRTYYGTCATTAGTNPQSVVCPEFPGTPNVGDVINVLFTNSITVQALRINSDSATPIYIKPISSGISGIQYSIRVNAGAMVGFVYDGTYWCTTGYISEIIHQPSASTSSGTYPLLLKGYSTSSDYWGSIQTTFINDNTKQLSASPGTGQLYAQKVTINGTITNNTDAATKQYVDNSINGIYVTAGKKSGTTLGDKATAEGTNNTATGNYSHAEGVSTTASNYYAHAEGVSTTASEQACHAEGSNSTASNYASHAEGFHTTASGMYSHAEGQYTIAAQTSQHVFGQYNIEDTSNNGTYVEIVGKGTADNARSNARTLDWSGNQWLAGTLKIGGTGYSDTNALEVATKQYVDNVVIGAMLATY